MVLFSLFNYGKSYIVKELIYIDKSNKYRIIKETIDKKDYTLKLQIKKFNFIWIDIASKSGNDADKYIIDFINLRNIIELINKK